MFRLAMGQIRVEGGGKEANLRRAERCVVDAAKQGAQVVALPEAMSLGWTHPSALTEADPIPDGRTYQALRQMARQSQVYVCAGLVERAGERIYNAAVLLDPQGQLLLHHRKLNELEIGHPFYGVGDRLQVARTPLGTFGLMICADAFAQGQVITRSLCYMGADVILSPSSWAVPADHDNAKEPYGQLWLDNYGPVARDFRVWIVGVSNVGWLTAGPWRGRKCIGCSLIVGPTGQPVVQARYGVDAEALVFQEIEPVARPAQGDGWQGFWSAQRPRLA